MAKRVKNLNLSLGVMLRFFVARALVVVEVFRDPETLVAISWKGGRWRFDAKGKAVLRTSEWPKCNAESVDALTVIQLKFQHTTLCSEGDEQYTKRDQMRKITKKCCNESVRSSAKSRSFIRAKDPSCGAVFSKLKLRNF